MAILNTANVARAAPWARTASGGLTRRRRPSCGDAAQELGVQFVVQGAARQIGLVDLLVMDHVRDLFAVEFPRPMAPERPHPGRWPDRIHRLLDRPVQHIGKDLIP